MLDDASPPPPPRVIVHLYCACPVQRQGCHDPRCHFDSVRLPLCNACATFTRMIIPNELLLLTDTSETHCPSRCPRCGTHSSTLTNIRIRAKQRVIYGRTGEYITEEERQTYQREVCSRLQARSGSTAAAATTTVTSLIY